MPTITIKMSNWQLEVLQVSAGMLSHMSVLTSEGVTARFFESLASQLKEVERDPEIGDIGPMGEVIWPDHPIVTQNNEESIDD